MNAVVNLGGKLRLSTRLFTVVGSDVIVAKRAPQSAVGVVALFGVANRFFTARLDVFIPTIRYPTAAAAAILRLGCFSVMTHFT